VKVVLDTCAVLWSVLAPEKLSPAAKAALTAEDTEVLVSAISCAEIACGVQRGRIRLDRHWRVWFRHFMDVNGWEPVDMDLDVMEEAYSLPEYPGNDPADRVIVATARVLQCPVITADRRIIEYAHVKTVWERIR
jgi:PIN domain nuclease of toxin-antitoxin system